MTPEPNRILVEPMADYLASDAVGGGSLFTLLGKSPEHYRAFRHVKPTSSALTLGTMAHLAILEPDEWWAGFVRRPPAIKLNTKVGKEAYAVIEKTNPGKVIVKADEFDAVEGMAEAVKEAGVMPLGMVERSVYWTGHAGLRLKCRPDNLHDGIHYSLKTTRDASQRAFDRDALYLGYLHSLGHYHNGLLAATDRVHQHVVIAVESKAPHVVSVIDVPRYVIAWGAAEMDQAVRLMVGCQADKVWPGYPRRSFEFGWMKSQVEGVPS